MIDSVILHCLAEKEKEGEVREERCTRKKGKRAEGRKWKGKEEGIHL